MPDMPLSKRERAYSTAIYLGCASALAVFSVQLCLHGIVRLGLGWSLNPGPILVLAVLTLCLYGIWRHSGVKTCMVIGALTIASLISELLPGSRLFSAFVGIALILTATSYALNALGRDLVWRTAYFLIAAYMLSVFFYNFFALRQRMNFFLPGWTS